MEIKLDTLVNTNIAPYAADSIGVYKDDTLVGYISLGDLKHDYDTRLYRVGLMSDTHYNDTDIDEDPSDFTDDGSQYAYDFINALKFFEEKPAVEFCCVAGDISSGNMTHVKNFRLQRDDYAPHTPVYSCKGNHDNKASFYNKDLWQKCVSLYGDGKEKIYCPVENETSFYFIKTLPNGQKDVYIFLDINYNNSDTSASVKLNVETDETNKLQYYNPETLKWFEGVLETHKYDRCFVFTHLFFKHKTGNNHGTGYKYYADHNNNYSLDGVQFNILNELNNRYKNSIWFTGHSHYKWDWQKYDNIINICHTDCYYTEKPNGIIIPGIYKCDSAYNVHLPSLARPLRYSEMYSVDLRSSEGAIMDVYYDYVDIRGIIFKTSDSDEYINKYYPISTYRIPIGGKNTKNII